MTRQFNEEQDKNTRKKSEESTDPMTASPYEQPGFWEEIGLEVLTREELDKGKQS